MSIIRHEIPILEFDTDPSAVLMPAQEGLPHRFPEKAVFAFLGGHIDAYAERMGCKAIGCFSSATKDYPVYVTKHRGEDILLMQAPVGAAASVQILDWLIGYGVRKVISGGCCGALEDFPEGVFLVPRRALRDEGTSYHYAPPSRFMDIDPRALRAMEAALQAHGLAYREVITWSTDGFFRETREKVAYRKSEGCSVVEMECSALAACAKLRGAVWGEILFTADTLADAEHYDERTWGRDAFSHALELCLDAACQL